MNQSYDIHKVKQDILENTLTFRSNDFILNSETFWTLKQTVCLLPFKETQRKECFLYSRF